MKTLNRSAITRLQVITITVIIVAPALVALGVPSHAIHAFVFYYAILSEVSPPVGLSPLV